jgi:hypothetical protein
MSGQRRLEVLGRQLSPTAAERASDIARAWAGSIPSSTTDSSAWFRGRCIIITGAAKGIGREAAALFARHGGSVVVTDLDAAEAAEVRPKSTLR